MQGPLLIDAIGLTGATLNTLCWLLQPLKAAREQQSATASLPAVTAGNMV